MPLYSIFFMISGSRSWQLRGPYRDLQVKNLHVISWLMVLQTLIFCGVLFPRSDPILMIPHLTMVETRKR